jgi:hypothetical protein
MEQVPCIQFDIDESKDASNYDHVNFGGVLNFKKCDFGVLVRAFL